MTTPTLELEYSLIERGFDCVIGVDEVGRGALAGPVWVSAALWSPACSPIPEGLRDSKAISEKKRPEMASRAQAWLHLVTSGTRQAEHIDAEGIVASLGLAGVAAIKQLADALSDFSRPVIVLDGNSDWLSTRLGRSIPVMTQTKADATAASVSGASVVAKVGRDTLMVDAEQNYPGYGFAGHKGYGSAAHRDAIERLGVCDLHRKTWIHPRDDQRLPGLD